MATGALSSLADAVGSSALVGARESVLALCSGGADSAALAAGLATALGPERVTALHLNYRLRPDSDVDEAVCGELCGQLGIELVLERPGQLPDGNLQAAARDARYRAAERVRSERGIDLIATGHTGTDLAETVLYRLAASPGRRALLGLRSRRGNVVRPLLGLSRERVRQLAVEAGLPFRDDPSNEQPLFARNRIRNEVLPVLREIAPAAEANIAETQSELAEEGEALEALAARALDESGAEAAGAISSAALSALDPAVRRIALRQLAERAAGAPVPLGRSRAAEITRLAAEPEGGVIELGGGVEAHVEQGHVRFSAGTRPEPAEASLSVPGVCRFGSWEVRAELEEGVPAVEGADVAVLDPAAIEGPLTVRPWREGDRMRPLGLNGTKSLQDLFTDGRVPRGLRRTLPVVTSAGRIAWIAGVAVSEEFAARPGAPRSAVLSASQTRP